MKKTLLVLMLFCMFGCSDSSRQVAKELKDSGPFKTKCRANLKQIEMAKAIVSGKMALGPGSEIHAKDVVRITGEDIAALKCPLGGTYTIGPVDTPATCSKHSWK